MLRHLKRAGVPASNLVKIYMSLVRPIIDYSSVVYHSLLTKGEENVLEDLQKKALRIVFGFKNSYEECLEKRGVPTLKIRRE